MIKRIFYIGLLLLISIASNSQSAPKLWISQSQGRMPDFLKGAVFYFDKDLSTVTDAGTLIVKDLSNCYNDVSQSTSGEKPTFSTSTGLSFDNTNDNLKFDIPIMFNAQNFTWYFKYYRSINSPTNSIFVMDDSDPFYNVVGSHPEGVWFYFQSASITLYAGPTAITISGLAAGDISGDHLYKIISKTDSVRFYVDGVYKGHAATPSTWKASCFFHIKRISSGIATFQKLNGQISQMLLYNKALTTDEQTTAETQLTNKMPIKRYSCQYRDCIGEFGQSNAAGRNRIANWATEYRTSTKGRVLDLLTGTLKYPYDSLDYGENTTYKSFELHIAYARNTPTYIFKYAIGSTWLHDTTQSNWNTAENVYSYALYYKSKTRYKYFLDCIRSEGYRTHWLFNVWMQGEQDATKSLSASLYETNLTNYINAVRAWTGQTDVKFIIPRINGNSDASEIYRATVKTAAQNVAANMTNVYSFSTESATFIDVVHYDITSTINIANTILTY